MTILSIPKHLREKLGDEASDEFVEILNKVEESGTGRVLQVVEEKFERRLSEEMGKLRTEMVEGNAKLREEMGSMKSELETKIASVQSNLEIKLAQGFAGTIKWLFIFWIGQVGVVIGLVFTILKFR